MRIDHAPAEPSDCNDCSEGPNLPRNVRLATGEFVWQQEDLRISGRGLDFVWTRTYRSRPESDGRHWDHAYNLRAEATRAGIRVWNGTGAADVYRRGSTEAYTARGVFAEGHLQTGDRFLLRFSGGGAWEFRPLDDHPAPGQVARIVDRNGNSLRFAYDENGRLDVVTDTLGRDIRLGYDIDGRLTMLTDFVDRRVSYRYSADDDLESVAYPVVTGTPTGNDFPGGASVGYTYAPAHRLVAITDRAGQALLDIEYAAAFDHDRVCSLRWGRSGNPVHFSYHAAEDSPGVIAIVNDGNGNVRDFLFDELEACVRVREYTDRAEATKPTTLTGNRPVHAVRAGEPPFYETRFSYDNPDGLMTRIVHPDGSMIEKRYEIGLRSDASPIERGNLRSVRLTPGPAGGEQPELVREFEYLPGFGCTCSQAFVTKEIDPRGSVRSTAYDDRGNPVLIVDPDGAETRLTYNGFGNVITREFAGDGTRARRDHFEYSNAHGQLTGETRDADGVALVTRHEYDELGRLVLLRDPAGHEHRHVWNAWDLLVRRVLPDDGSGADPSTEDMRYDANGNRVVRVVRDSRRVVTETRTYDATGRLLATSRQAESGPQVVTAYEYDDNGNRVATRRGTSHLVRVSYDTLDRPSRQSWGEPGKGYREVTFDYDPVGNLVRVTRGTGAERSVTHAHYDGYGRVARIEAPNGTTVSFSHDPNGNVVRQVVRSPRDDTSILELGQSFDAMDRLVRRTTAGADAEPAIESWEFDARARPVRQVDIVGRTRQVRYDALDRPVEVDDDSGRMIRYVYDPNSNLLEEVVIDRASDRQLRTGYVRDPRGRVLEVTAPRGMSRTYTYDGSDFPATIGLPGECRVRLDYDVLARPTRASWTDADASDEIEIRQDWDDSSRLVARTDPNGNTTRYVHDAAGNVVAIEHPDGAKETFRFDTRGNCIGWTDPNGSTIVNVYDSMDRLVRRDINPGGGVATDSTVESYQYDALGRLVGATNDRHTVEWTYDARSRVVTEVQDGRAVHSTYDGRGRRTSVDYPSGYRLIFDYAGVNLRRIQDARGPVVELEGGGTTRYARTPVIASAAWNSVGLPERRVTTRGGATLDERHYRWDEAGVLAGIEVRNSRGARSVSYTADFLGRLRASTLSAGRGVEYDLDPAGNRTLVHVDGKAGRYSMDGSGDRATNRYTATPADRRTYDANGNLLTVTDAHGHRRSMRYDYRNRMVEYRDETTGAVTRYGYDCFGRRLLKSSSAGDGRVEVISVFDGDAVIEENNVAAGSTRSLVRYGPSVYGVIASPPGEDRWFIADALGSIVAEFDQAGTVTSAYEYGDYGQVSIQGPSAPVLFAGYTYDEESGLYYLRTRYMEPATGRFTTPDSAGVWEDGRHRGNAYAYAGNNPATFLDPTGMVTRHISCNGPWPGPRVIEVEYQGCSSARRALLDQPVCRAFRASGQSMERVLSLWSNDFFGVSIPGAGTTRAQVQKWFGGPDNATNTYSKSYIANTLGYVFGAIKSDDFDIDCEGGGGTCSTANAYVAWGGWDVNLCNNFFNSSFSISKQAAIIIHELTHAYADTEDYFYYSTDGSNLPWNLLFETPVMRENADTYEQFTLEFFLPASTGSGSSGLIESIPEPMPLSVGAAAWRFGPHARSKKRIDIFARGDDHRVYQLFQKNGGWSTWAPNAGDGTFDSGPAAASWGANRLDVFAIGKDRRLYHTFWNGEAWSGWHVPVVATHATFTSGPAVASWAANRLDVVARGDDHRLYHIWYEGGLGWSLGPLGGETFDGTFDSGPAAVSWGPNRLDVFAVGKDRRMYQYWWNGGGWNFAPLGFDATFSSGPAAASWGPNRLDVVARGDDHRLYHIWHEVTLGWSLGPLGAGTPVANGRFDSGPAAVSVGSNRIDVFAVGKDRRMWRAAWKDNAWSGWFDDMGTATFS